MKISILLNEPYPLGMACTNRVQMYAKGLLEVGNDVEIIIPRPTEAPGKIRNHKVSGKNEGVKFKYASNPIKSKSFMGRRIQNFLSPINTFFLLLYFKPDIILIVANTFKYILIGKICAVFLNAKLVREKSEVPFYRLENITHFKKVRSKIEFSLFDGLFVISESLKSFFINELSLKLKILEVPIIISNHEDSLLKYDLTNIKPNLVYTGSLLNHKDGILTIINAFARIAEKYPHFNLIMTGDIDKSKDKEKILTLISKLNINGKVELTGYISKEELIEITSTATALLLSKPDNRQNRYNMATKIGEYLLTGRPAIISSVDPICFYLSHRQDVLITEPNEEQLIQEIEFILNNSNEANDIGLAGKKSAIKLFDYKVHALNMSNFLKEL